jgi:hypothetical protein
VQHLIQSLSAPQKDAYIFYRSFSLADEKYDRQTNYPKSSSQKFRGSSGSWVAVLATCQCLE